MKAQDLKNSILQLAIQGKLVPQDPNDESAEVLYAKIQAEKQKLIKEGKIKKDRPLPPITDDEIPFEIPLTWKWVRLSDIVYSVPTKEYQILQSEIIDNGKYPVVSQSQQLIEGYSDKIEKLYKHEKPVLIFGDHTRCLKLIDFDFIVGADGTKILYPYAINEKYLYYAIQYFIINMVNRGYSRHFQFIKDKEIPLPPLAEQHRIVAKIEELEPLVKQYDKVETELSVLNDSFPEQLKKSILQYAIQGKLVAQDANDEPAEVLYANIQAEKQKLVKEGKIKKDKPLPSITDDEIPFPIPSTWKWVRWGDLSQEIQYGYNASAQSIGRIKMVRISDIQEGTVLWDTVPYCEISEKDIPTYTLRPNDILFARTGGTVGKSYLVKEVPEEAIYAGYLIRTRYSSSLSPDYMKYFMESQLYWDQLKNGTIATAQPNCNGKTLAKMLLPLPPLAEQHRIVTKVTELMQYCEKLKI